MTVTESIAAAIASRLKEIFAPSVRVSLHKMLDNHARLNGPDAVVLFDEDGQMLGRVVLNGGVALVEMKGSKAESQKIFEISNPNFPDVLYEWVEQYWEPRIFLNGYKLKAISLMDNAGWAPTESVAYFIKSVRSHPILGRMADVMSFTLLTVEMNKQSVKDWINGF